MRSNVKVGDEVMYDAGYCTFYGIVIEARDPITMNGAVLISAEYRCGWSSVSNPKYWTNDVMESGWLRRCDLVKLTCPHGFHTSQHPDYDASVDRCAECNAWDAADVFYDARRDR